MTPADRSYLTHVANALAGHDRVLFADLPRDISGRKDAVERERVRTVVDDILFEFLKQKPRLAA